MKWAFTYKKKETRISVARKYMAQSVDVNHLPFSVDIAMEKLLLLRSILMMHSQKFRDLHRKYIIISYIVYTIHSLKAYVFFGDNDTDIGNRINLKTIQFIATTQRNKVTRFFC